VVIGGGISGLSLTWFLRSLAPRIPISIHLLEGSDSLGGWIKTSKKGNFLFEEGPRGFRPSRNGAEILKLVEELQLQDDILISSTRASARYILQEGCVTVRKTCNV
jgi:oxygen-dependent protoporphyrinogen oxidase